MIYDKMKEKNPDHQSMIGQPIKLKPPQVVKAGAKKTAFVNFVEICQMLHRQPHHLLAFLLAELQTTGSINASNQLLIKGKFKQNHIENIL